MFAGSRCGQAYVPLRMECGQQHGPHAEGNLKPLRLHPVARATPLLPMLVYLPAGRLPTTHPPAPPLFGSPRRWPPACCSCWPWCCGGAAWCGRKTRRGSLCRRRLALHPCRTGCLGQHSRQQHQRRQELQDRRRRAPLLRRRPRLQQTSPAAVALRVPARAVQLRRQAAPRASRSGSGREKAVKGRARHDALLAAMRLSPFQ